MSDAEYTSDSRVDAQQARAYWSGIDATVNGMLGGFPSVSRVDVQGSRAFLAKMGVGSKEGLRRVERVLEGGAGYVRPFPSFFPVLLPHFLSSLVPRLMVDESSITMRDETNNSDCGE